MKMGSFFKNYFSSALGLLNILVPFATFGIVVATGFPWMVGLIAGVADGLALFIFAFASGRGAKAVVDEKDRRVLLDYGQNLNKIKQQALRTGSLRVVDTEIAKIKDYASLKAGEYAAAAEKEKTWEPKVLDAIENILLIIDVFQKGADQASTEGRFSMDSSLSPADFKKRIMGLLKEETLKITDAQASLDPGTVNDRLSIMEDIQ